MEALSSITQIKDAIANITLRSDKQNDENVLFNTFVDIPGLISSLKSVNSHVIFGRRGTGKTHILKYLKTFEKQAGDIPIYIDLRTIGSSDSIYSNECNTVPVKQRALRLLLDVLESIHTEIRSALVQNQGRISDYNNAINEVDEVFADLITESIIEGSSTQELNCSRGTHQTSKSSIIASLDPSKPHVDTEFGKSSETDTTIGQSIKREGKICRYLDYRGITDSMQRIMKSIDPIRIWLLIDEFSAVPIELQPYLADMFKRVFIPISNIVLKISAVEYRVNLFLDDENHSRLGMELGADIFSEYLDEYFVYDCHEKASLDFFKTLFYNHINSLLEEGSKLTSHEEFVSVMFASEDAFLELVRASEGVPRDAIQILTHASSLSGNESKISIKNVREAARTWYVKDKHSNVVRHDKASKLLNWIIDEVIKGRQARAFLLEDNVQDDLIRYLFDARLLHIIRKDISAKDTPGHRYYVYSIDYGCYCEMIKSRRDNQFCLFSVGDENGEERVIVPKNDYRSIRRAILDMSKFYHS